MRVVALWRYPVKSMQGEALDEAALGALGVEGDRSHGILDVATGRVLTARRDPPLLMAAARWRPDGGVTVILPGGRVAAGDGDLSAWLGRPVRLEPAGAVPAPTYEADDAQPWDGPGGALHDDGNVRVSLLGLDTVARLGPWDLRRFRPNVVLDGGGEDGLVGRRVRLGEVVLDVVQPIVRCVMVARPQPGGIEADVDVLRTIVRERAGTLAVGALVARPGRVRPGDEVHVIG